jgi:hypothetical protein
MLYLEGGEKESFFLFDASQAIPAYPSNKERIK